MTINQPAPKRSDYQSYLLRLWRDGPGDSLHASLEETSSGERRFFCSLDLLVDFLAQMETQGGDR